MPLRRKVSVNKTGFKAGSEYITSTPRIGASGNDDEIYVSSSQGKILIRAHVTEDIVPGVVCLLDA